MGKHKSQKKYNSIKKRPAHWKKRPKRKKDGLKQVLHQDQAESLKMDSNSFAVKVEGVKSEMFSSEQPETIKTEICSTSDPLEITVKYEPEDGAEDSSHNFLEMIPVALGDVLESIPDKVEIVEVPDGAVDSIVIPHRKRNLPELAPESNEPKRHNTRSRTNQVTIQEEALMFKTRYKYTGRDKFDIFSEFVAVKLREIRSADQKVVIMNSIIELFENHYT